jgi:hypothetical protein
MGISRKTFYGWKDTKPELAREIAKAESKREERIRQMLYSSLKKRLDGYTMVEEKETYLPDANNPGEVTLKSKTIRKKNCLPDFRTVKLLLERQDKMDKAISLPQEETGTEYTEYTDAKYDPEEEDAICDESENTAGEDTSVSAGSETSASPKIPEADDEEEIGMEEFFERIDKALTARRQMKKKPAVRNNGSPVYLRSKRGKKRRK